MAGGGEGLWTKAFPFHRKGWVRQSKQAQDWLALIPSVGYGAWGLSLVVWDLALGWLD